MRLAVVDDITDGLAFLGRKPSDVDQRGDLRVSCLGDDGAGVGVAGQHDRAIEPFQNPIDCRDVVGQGT